MNNYGGSTGLDQLTFSHFRLQELISETREKNGWVTRELVEVAFNIEKDKLDEVPGDYSFFATCGMPRWHNLLQPQGCPTARSSVGQSRSN